MAALEGVLVPAGLDMHDPQVIDDYGLEAVAEPPYPLLAVEREPGTTLGERTRRCVRASLLAHGLREGWPVLLHGERVVGGSVEGGEGLLDTEIELTVLDPAGCFYADLLVYRLDVADGLVTAAWYVVG